MAINVLERKSLPILHGLEVTACSCNKCKNMCKAVPCVPLPDEAQQLIEAGYGSKLYSFKDEYDDEFITVLGIAPVEMEGAQKVYRVPGECTLLTPEGLCPLHDTAFKPFEARAARCDVRGAELDELSEAIRSVWLPAWSTPLGKKVVKRWQDSCEQWRKENGK